MQDGKIFDSEELEQMRLQYASLKEDLEKQKIINGKMMESVFRKNIGILDTDRKIGIAGGLVAVPLVFAVCIIQGLDMWIAVVLGAVFLAQTVAYLMLYRRLGPVGNGQENVLDTAVGIRKFRKGYIAINTALWVLVLAVFVVMGVEIYHAWSTPVKGLAAVGILVLRKHERLISIAERLREQHHDKGNLITCPVNPKLRFSRVPVVQKHGIHIKTS